jgi:6,7-dimethyl-8-ribityllumazine synthase
MSTPKVIEGGLVVPAGAKFAIVASRFNHFIVDRLVEGAVDGLVRHGADATNVSIVRVPGAWEIPPTVARIAAKKKVDAILAVGAVIRGSTPHFDYVASEVSKGVAQVALQTGVPVAFGVLTTENVEQAEARIDRAADAVRSALEMADLFARLRASAAG